MRPGVNPPKKPQMCAVDMVAVSNPGRVDTYLDPGTGFISQMSRNTFKTRTFVYSPALTEGGGGLASLKFGRKKTAGENFRRLQKKLVQELRLKALKKIEIILKKKT